RPGNFLQSRP
nr:Chain P, GAG POLYPROTEIN [synthetic construct]1MT9_P Chain P, p1-p6 Gag substrate decapeptide [synthetic construct]3D3T_P Chain P, P1-P6 SUBSTRATE PEPTIDE [synthetic construct]4OBG_E Chain E, p1-p6 peptide [Human immunodeficiency virus 1]4OBG_F Chain F, p1-p6 peptide [Human immunodeficiency virus 1]4QJ2_F Chain F, p1-p6 peptide [Human immunodeficiency virus 1]4QJ2_G Chain G, p1-p6 peptide [Human immunodeficiency virus 1]